MAKKRTSDEVFYPPRTSPKMGSRFSRDDWDLCLNIEECAKESRNHDNSDIPNIIASAAESVLGPSNRIHQSLTSVSADDDSILLPPKKKAKRDSDVVSRQSLSSNSSASTHTSYSSVDDSPWASFMGYGGFPLQSAHPTSNSSFPFSTTSFFDLPGGLNIWGRRGDEERKNFEIHEETEEEQENAEQIATITFDPAFGDDNKENEPAERGEEPPSVDPTQEFHLARRVLGELLDYNLPPPDDQITIATVLESQATEVDEESLPELPEDPQLLDGLLTPTFEPPIGLPLEEVWTDECEEYTDNEYVQGDEHAEL